MNPDDQRNSKLARVVQYGAVALIAAWSLLALAGYAALGFVGDLLGSVDVAGGWIAWSGDVVGLVGGPAVTLLWLVGTLLILGAMAVIRRFAT
ncbi:MAG: hypothetical protein AB7I79_20745 [Rhizobiaceae bacterium]